MAPRETHSRRLARVEEALTPIFVEIEALRILLQLLIDFDFHRVVETETEPFLFELQFALEEMLDEIDPDTEEVTEQIRMAALAAALVMTDRGERETVDIEVDGGQAPANDD